MSSSPTGSDAGHPLPTAATAGGVISDGIRLHVDDSGGDGRPVVLVHGWPLSGDSWSDQVATLTLAGYRVVTYDRRGFGHSEAATTGAYDYDTLADDLATIIEELDLHDATLVGFSMGGGEVVRYVARHGEARLRSIVLAAAVPPYLMTTDDNPDGPLSPEDAAQMRAALEQDRTGFLDDFATGFFSVDGVLKVTEQQRNDALALALQSDQDAALGCMDSWAGTDFRADLEAITVPTLVVHGDSDATVPFEGSGRRSHEAIAHSSLVVVEGAPHGLNVSHRPEFDRALLEFLG